MFDDDKLRLLASLELASRSTCDLHCPYFDAILSAFDPQLMIAWGE